MARLSRELIGKLRNANKAYNMGLIDRETTINIIRKINEMAKIELANRKGA
jgi:hypothetical protein